MRTPWNPNLHPRDAKGRFSFAAKIASGRTAAALGTDWRSTSRKISVTDASVKVDLSVKKAKPLKPIKDALTFAPEGVYAKHPNGETYILGKYTGAGKTAVTLPVIEYIHGVPIARRTSIPEDFQKIFGGDEHAAMRAAKLYAGGYRLRRLDPKTLKPISDWRPTNRNF